MHPTAAGYLRMASAFALSIAESYHPAPRQTAETPRGAGLGPAAVPAPPPPPRGVRHVHKKTYATADPLAAAQFVVDHLGASGPGANHHSCGATHSVTFEGTASDKSEGDNFQMHFVFNPHKPPGKVYMNASDLGLYEEHLRGASFRNNSMDQFMDNHVGLVVDSLDPYVARWRRAGIPFVCRTWCCGPGMPQYEAGRCPPYSLNRTWGCEVGCYVEVPHGIIMELQCGLRGYNESLACLTLVKPQTFDLCSGKN